MKRIITSILCLCLLVGALSSCAGCGKHSTDPNAKGHDFLDQWSTNATYHWHDCSDKTCTVQIDKAEHTWGEPTLVKEATVDGSGELKYVCTVCDRSKTETVDFEGFDASIWTDLAKADNFANVTIEENITKNEVYKSAYYRINAEGVLVTTVNTESSETESEFVEEATAQRLRTYFTDVFTTIIPLGNQCVYVGISKNFTSDKTFDVTIDGVDYKLSELDISVTSESKVSSLKFVLTDAAGAASKYEISLSAYGTTKFPE